MTFPQMMDLQSFSTGMSDPDKTLRALTMKAIWTAVVAGNTVTAAISGTGPSSEDKNKMFKDLGASGLVVTNSGSTFTVAWA